MLNSIRFEIMWRALCYCVVYSMFAHQKFAATLAGPVQLLSKPGMEKTDADAQQDMLRPYSNGHADRKRSHRYVRDCQHIKHGNKTFEVHPASNHTNKSSLQSLRYLTHKITKRKSVFESENRYVHGHIAVINNPVKTFTVLLAKQKLSCSEAAGDREKVSITSNLGKCILATNAGFFNTHNGGCLGNIVTNGHLVHDSKGIQNANFGIRKDGSIVTGYLPEDEVTSNNFFQLVSGVGWLVRNGEIYLNQSKRAECADTEETGTIERFFDVISARTAIGHDKNGRIIIAQIDGKTDKDGVNLLQFAQLLKKHGAVNAINLDGGGSSTFVVNGTVLNYPSDSCGEDFSCQRKVSTIICIHEPVLQCDCNSPSRECANRDCNSSTDINREATKNKKVFHKGQRLHTVPNAFLEDEANVAQYKERSFAIIWFVALSAILGCSLLGNVYLVNLLRSRKDKETSWQTSDLRSLLAEDSDGV